MVTLTTITPLCYGNINCLYCTCQIYTHQACQAAPFWNKVLLARKNKRDLFSEQFDYKEYKPFMTW